MTTSEIPQIDPETFARLPKRGVMVIDFTAAWCPPCKAMLPILGELAREYAGHVRMVAVDVEQQDGLAQQFGVRAMPTFVILRDGQEVGRVLGSRSRAFVRGVLDRALAGDVAITAP